MDYYVTGENTSYYHWQIELLLQSFKLHGLSNDIVVGLAENHEPKIVDYTANIQKHKRLFVYDNYGQKRGYTPINKAYSLYTALVKGIVKQPFTLLNPDMLMLSPIPEQPEDISFQLSPLLSMDFFEYNGCFVKKHVKEILRTKKIDEEISYWIPVGSVMVFNNVPNEFFARVVEWTEILEFARRRTTPSDDSNWSERAAWPLCLFEYHGHLTYKGRYDYEMTLMDNNKAHYFINYENGLPPVFNKKKYQYRPPDGFTMGNLWDDLLASNPNQCTQYLQTVVRSYLKMPSTK